MRPSALLLVLAACNPDGGLKVYNDPPEVSFTSPADGATFAEGVPVTLMASVHDAQQALTDLDLAWNLDDGSTLVGEQTFTDLGVTFTAEDLPAGDIVVTLTAVDDSSESGEDSVHLHIVPDAAPTVSFVAPLDGAVVAAEDLLRVEILAADTDEADLSGLALAWTGAADVDTAPTNPDSSGAATFVVDSLEAGEQAMSVTVTDSLGATGTALVTFTAELADADLDGHRGPDWDGDDCDDADAAVYPGAVELCNGVDDDCDGVVDEDDASDALSWYADADGDGYGDPANDRAACDAPDGYVADATDCDDADGGTYPDAVETCDGADQDCDGDTDEADAIDAPTWYTDLDGDGYGDAAAPVEACDVPGGAVANADDCDDGSAGVYPGATETCDGEDDDCDGTVDEDDAADAPTWYVDADLDGYGGGTTARACTQPTGAYAASDDCDDGDAGVYPGADEYCDGEDDDCDGTVDEDDALDASTWYVDGDGDGWGEGSTTAVACAAPSGFVSTDTDCDDGDVAFHPGAAETDCADPNDYNCDGAVGYDDGDGDGWAACEECDDAVAAVSPDATEVCNDADDDCDGTIDEPDAADALTWYADTDADGYGDPSSTTPACEAPTGYVADATDCDDADGSENPAASERCDGDDDDCDAEVDEDSAVDAPTWYADADGDSFGDAAVTDVACELPSGFVADATDCDDTRAATNPSAAETCDTADDDCDGEVDEDDAVDVRTWYADADGDTFGDPASDDVDCDQPTGFVADDTDCDDTIAAVNPDATEVCNADDDDCDGVTDEADAADALTWYADTDGDGYGDAGATVVSCSAPTGYVADATDCDDTDAAENPAASERCDGDDDDCDGSVDEDSAVDAPTWYADTDGDGYGDAAATDVACSRPSGYVADSTDCDDARAATNPGATEYCNTYDDDCDGTTDEDSAADASTWYADTDGDGYGDATTTDAACSQPSGYVADATDCDDTRAATNPGATEYCNTYDDDCDGSTDEDSAVDASTWYADTDGDGYGNASATDVACSLPSGYVADATDCDDTRAATHPGATEYCNTHDDDCDGSTDEDSAADAATWYRDADADTYGDAAVTDVECSQPSGYVSNATDCDDTRAATNPAASEYCNSRDDDCDGTTDEDSAVDASTWHADADGDTYGNVSVTDVACSVPSGYVADATDCDDTRSTSNPAATEYCNLRDDDCDGATDEDAAADATTWYADTDGDSHGDPYVTDDACSAPSGYVILADDCDDTDASTNPSATEYCDGEDDDCDGTVDEDDAADAGTWYLDDDGDAFGQTAVSVVACDAPTGYAADAGDCDDADDSEFPYADEYCDGDDDDCDGTVDEDDAVDATTWHADTDGDGYGSTSVADVECSAPSGYVSDATDCDDASSAISPADTEVCDAADTDEDCDGLADDADPSASTATMSTYYVDSDADGYAGATTVVRCDGSSTYLSTSTDCNDASGAISPGATEVCDALDTDEDCDGVADDEGSSGCVTYYVDADGDGYGDATSACLCSSDATYTATRDGDCDDTDSAVSPVADEDDANGIDDDCDGLTDEVGIEWPIDSDYTSTDLQVYHGAGDRLYQRHIAEGSEDWDGDGYGEYLWSSTTSVYVYEATNATASITGRASFTGTLTSAAIVGDQDGDGLAEILVGSPSTSTYGRVYLIENDAAASGAASTLATTTITATSAYSGIGYALANAGDLYGDGTDDFIVASGSKMEVMDGPLAAGNVSVSTAAATITGAWAVESDGDLDGDGTPDIVVGSQSGGYVYVLDGTSVSGTITASTSADATLTAETSGDYGGFAIDLADDLDGDGYDDLLVGAYYGGSSHDGKAYVVRGPVTSGSLANADLVLDGESTSFYAGFGYSVEGLGDIDDDGDGDFAVGATGDAAVYLFSYEDGGRVLTLDDAFASFATYQYRFGSAVTNVGDLDADGFNDIFLPAYYLSTTDYYRAYVIHSNFRRMQVSASDAYVANTSTYYYLGVSVAGAGDFNGDGFDDLIAGAYGMLNGSTSAGGALVLFGPYADVENASSYDCMFTGVNADDDIGTAVAGGADFDGDAYDDVVIGGPTEDTIGTNAGSVYVFGGDGTGYRASVTAADATFRGAATGDQFGWSVAVVPDLDGDTYDELLVGAPYHDNPGVDAGRAYLYSAPFATTGEAAVATLTSEHAGDYLGYSVHGGGDVDGDGFPDLLLGAPHNDHAATDAGAAYLFTSMPSGTVAVSTADTLLRGEANSDYFGTSVAILGDANGDGYDDLAAGAPGYGSGTTNGAVYVFFGPVSTGELSASTADWSLTGENGSSQLGTEVAPAGDLDGDGRMDMLMSGSLTNTYAQDGAIHGPFEGRVPFWFYPEVTATIRRGVAGIGDSDGDGHDDWAVGADRDNGYGNVFIQWGR